MVANDDDEEEKKTWRWRREVCIASDLALILSPIQLLFLAPTSVAHVRRVNVAEAEFWKRSEGYRLASSDRILGFECGGQQWVFEVCHETGNNGQSTGLDMAFVTSVLDMIELAEIPAPGPVEQRWTCASPSPMSPAHHANPHAVCIPFPSSS